MSVKFQMNLISNEVYILLWQTSLIKHTCGVYRLYYCIENDIIVIFCKQLNI